MGLIDRHGLYGPIVWANHSYSLPWPNGALLALLLCFHPKIHHHIRHFPMWGLPDFALWCLHLLVGTIG